MTACSGPAGNPGPGDSIIRRNTLTRFLAIAAAVMAVGCLKPPPGPPPPPKLAAPWDKGCDLGDGLEGLSREGRPSGNLPELWAIERAADLCDKASRGLGRCRVIATDGSPYPRIRETVEWNERELLVWGGCAFRNGRLVKADDGAAFDPISNTWTPLDWQSYAEKRAIIAAAPSDRSRPIALLTQDWIARATLSAHLLETQGLTLIWGGFVAKPVPVACNCRDDDSCDEDDMCFDARVELIPDGVVIAWMGKVSGEIQVGTRPIAGAQIRILAAGSQVVAETESAVDGTFLVEMPAGNYAVEIRKPGFDVVSYPVSVRRSEVATVRIELIPSQ